MTTPQPPRKTWQGSLDDFLKPLAADRPLALVAREVLLTEAEGLLRLVHRPPRYGLEGMPSVPGGLWFDREPGLALMYDSLLYVFPPPYHPVEVMMANRGWVAPWSGKFDYREFEKVNQWRGTDWAHGMRMASSVLDLPPSFVRVLFHLFTPFHTTADPREAEAESLRVKLYEGLGYEGYLAYSTIREVRDRAYGPFYNARFWKDTAEGVL